MNNLTITAYWTRKIIKYGGATMIVLMLLQGMLSTAIDLYKKAHPPEEKADLRFGKLVAIKFPEKNFDQKEFSIKLPDDKLPKVPKFMRVYSVERPSNSLLALENAKKIASDLGFVSEPSEVNGSGSGTYQFKNEAIDQSLTMNVLDGSFKMKYPYLTDQLLTTPEKMPVKEQAISIASQYLSKAKALTSDLQAGEKAVSYYKISFDRLEPQSAPNGSNLAKVDFYEEPIVIGSEKYKIVPLDPASNPVNVLVSGSSALDRQVVEVNYKHSMIDREIYGKYPIKTAETALSELKLGKYFPAKDVASKNVSIFDMYLAYYQPEVLDKTMQPIYVFEDEKGNFVAYVTALDESLGP